MHEIFQQHILSKKVTYSGLKVALTFDVVAKSRKVFSFLTHLLKIAQDYYPSTSIKLMYFERNINEKKDGIFFCDNE